MNCVHLSEYEITVSRYGKSFLSLSMEVIYIPIQYLPRMVKFKKDTCDCMVSLLHTRASVLFISLKMTVVGSFYFIGCMSV